MTEYTKSIQVTAAYRAETGKKNTKFLRKTKKIPAVINNNKSNAIHIEIDDHLPNIMHQRGELISSVFEIKIDEENTIKAIVDEVQHHCVTGKIEHIDFQEVRSFNNKVKVFLYFVNTESSSGIKRGGILNIIKRHVVCMCPENKIIRSIDCDVSKKSMGDFIRLNEIRLPEDISFAIKDTNTIIANIIGKKGKLLKDEAENKESESVDTKTTSKVVTKAATKAPATAAKSSK